LAITGEMNLQGYVTAIGGLDMKIIGGINAGVKTFVFPKENQKDYDKFIEKYEGNTILTGINFITVETIHEAISYAIIKKSDSSNLLEL
jgi:ATP-dependent Lon protease